MRIIIESEDEDNVLDFKQREPQESKLGAFLRRKREYNSPEVAKARIEQIKIAKEERDQWLAQLTTLANNLINSANGWKGPIFLLNSAQYHFALTSSRDFRIRISAHHIKGVLQGFVFVGLTETDSQGSKPATDLGSTKFSTNREFITLIKGALQQFRMHRAKVSNKGKNDAITYEEIVSENTERAAYLLEQLIEQAGLSEGINRVDIEFHEQRDLSKSKSHSIHVYDEQQSTLDIWLYAGSPLGKGIAGNTNRADLLSSAPLSTDQPTSKAGQDSPPDFGGPSAEDLVTRMGNSLMLNDAFSEEINTKYPAGLKYPIVLLSTVPGGQSKAEIEGMYRFFDQKETFPINDPTNFDEVEQAVTKMFSRWLTVRKAILLQALQTSWPNPRGLTAQQIWAGKV